MECNKYRIYYFIITTSYYYYNPITASFYLTLKIKNYHN